MLTFGYMVSLKEVWTTYPFSLLFSFLKVTNYHRCLKLKSLLLEQRQRARILLYYIPPLSLFEVSSHQILFQKKSKMKNI